MILEAVLNHIKLRLQAAALTVGAGATAFTLDGSKDKMVTFGVVNSDSDKETIPLRLGIDIFEVPLDSTVLPRGLRQVREIDSNLGRLQIEETPRNVDHFMNFHLSVRETRIKADRINDYPLNLEWVKIQSKFMGVMRPDRQIYRVTDNGVLRGYETRLEASSVTVASTTRIRSIYRYRVSYPLVDNLASVQAFLAKEFALISNYPKDTAMPDLTNYPNITLPDKAKMTRY
jgi:hypothetical protein